MSSGTAPDAWLQDPESLIAEARAAISLGEALNWPQLLQNIGASFPRSAVASDQTVEGVRDLLQSEMFQSLEGSWNLPHFLLTNWQWLSPEGRNLLREPIAGSFDLLSNWMGAFVAGEILGECYCDPWSMRRLATLSKSARMPARSLVPHALECFAKTTPAAELREEAIDLLQELTSDSEKAVRDEASESLFRLG